MPLDAGSQGRWNGIDGLSATGVPQSGHGCLC